MNLSLPFQLHAVAAMAENRVIGREGTLPWHLPEELKLFKKLTLGHPVIMGRHTWESMGRPLPGRENIVVSAALAAEGIPGAVAVASIDQLANLGIQGDAYLIGGASLYRALLPACQSLYLTFVKGEYTGDTFFPEFEHLFEHESVLVETEAFRQCRYLKRRT